jgi:hypothetical protein
VETAGIVREEPEAEHHFAREGPRLSTEVLNRGAWPSRGLPFA